jgi:methyltransferase-like protein
MMGASTGIVQGARFPEGPAVTGDVRHHKDGFAARTGASGAGRDDPAPSFDRPHAHGHPARVAAIARLFGLDAPPPDGARVLEIGCADGRDIIPLAAQHPRGVFLGLESSAAQARRGNERIARLGLLNIRILRGDLAAFEWQSRRFDYILCHDAYRHGSTPLRAAILRVVASCLEPNGIVYIGHNVLPGWRHNQVLRDVLMSRLRADCDAATQLAQARAYLGALSRWRGPETPHHRSVRAAATEAVTMPDDYFAHELLNDDNEPETFTRFVEESARAGLAYLGDSDLRMMQAESLGPDGRMFPGQPSGDLAAPTEQSIDILTGRSRRSSLLVHAARSPMITRAVDRTRLEGLHFLGDLRRSDGVSLHALSTFVGAGGRRLSTSNPAAQRAFEALIERSPASLSFVELLAAAAPRGGISADDRAAVVEAVCQAVVAGIIEARAAPAPAESAVATHPFAAPWRRSDVAAGEGTLASLRHEPVVLDDVARILLPLLDGAHDHAALADALIARATAGELRLSRNGDAASDAQTIRARAQDHVARALDRLCASALLSAPAPTALSAPAPRAEQSRRSRLA